MSPENANERRDNKLLTGGGSVSACCNLVYQGTKGRQRVLVEAQICGQIRDSDPTCPRYCATNSYFSSPLSSG